MHHKYFGSMPVFQTGWVGSTPTWCTKFKEMDIIELWNKREEEKDIRERYPNMNFILSLVNIPFPERIRILEKIDENPAILAEIYKED